MAASCLVRLTQVYDYGPMQAWKEAGGAAYYYSVMSTLSVMNRCVPIAKVIDTATPPRCAYPVCDNATNPWMVCDTEFPSLWVPIDAAQRRKCEIKFENRQVAKLATQRPSPLVERIADAAGSVRKSEGPAPARCAG